MQIGRNSLQYFDLDKLAPAPSVLLWESVASPIGTTEMELFEDGHFDIERVNTVDQLLETALASSHPLTGESRFEMILLDERLLAAEGVQILLLLRQLTETKGVPILLVGDFPSDRFSYWMKAGAQGFMTR